MNKKFAVITMVKNEADIINFFISHTLSLFDYIYIVDQQSNDGTEIILENISKKYENIFLIKCDFIGRHQKEVMNLIIPLVFNHDVEAIFFLDSDEFLQISSKEELHTRYSQLYKKDTLFYMNWIASMPLSFDKDINLIDDEFYIQNGISYSNKIILTKQFYFKFNEVKIQQGNHTVSIYRHNIKKIRTQLFSGLYHLPIRSKNQFICKTFMATISNFAKNEYMKSNGFHKKLMLEAISNGSFNDVNILSIAGRYGTTNKDFYWANPLNIVKEGFVIDRFKFSFLKDFNYINNYYNKNIYELQLASCILNFKFENISFGNFKLFYRDKLIFTKTKFFYYISNFYNSIFNRIFKTFVRFN